MKSPRRTLDAETISSCNHTRLASLANASVPGEKAMQLTKGGQDAESAENTADVPPSVTPRFHAPRDVPKRPD